MFCLATKGVNIKNLKPRKMRTQLKKSAFVVALVAMALTFSVNLQAATPNNGSDTTKMAKKKMDKMDKMKEDKMKMDDKMAKDKMKAADKMKTDKMKMDDKMSKEKMKSDDKMNADKMKTDSKMKKEKMKMAKDSSKMKM